MVLAPITIDTILRHAEGLSAFDTPEKAEEVLFGIRDQQLQWLVAEAEADGRQLDLTEGSLKLVEHWYFSPGAVETAKRKAEPRRLALLETAVATYFGAVVVNICPGAQWVVQRFFRTTKYELAVRKGSGSITLSSFGKKLRHPKNHGQDCIWRTYRHYFLFDRANQIDF